MDTININNDNGNYPIYIGNDLIQSLKDIIKKNYSSILVVTDNHVAKLYLEAVTYRLRQESVFTKIIQAGEKSKSINVFYDIHSHLIKSGFDRHSLIIALGGGVVGDLAGFVAATYMRGIDYIHLPTTILAHDSSVGGKVAINHENGKNMIGSFYPPCMIVYDTHTLTSLPLRQVRSGYAELIKEALINDETFFDLLLKCHLRSLTKEEIHYHIKKGILIKAKIVEEDEKEKGIRKYLNLGHTLGHALETSLGYGRITHGEAVAIGLLFSIYVSEHVFSVKLPFHSLFHWLKKNNYPMALSKVNLSKLVSLMKSDKKTINQTIQMVLLTDIAKPTVKSIHDSDLIHYMKHFFCEIGSDVK